MNPGAPPHRAAEGITTMQDNLDHSACGACFEGKGNVVEEDFADDTSAFSRYAFLARQGGAPALCQDPSGIYYVCHIRLPGEGRRN